MAKTVLIIDDDPDDVILFSEALYELNLSHCCLTATSPEDGLRLLKEVAKKPDFIFLDLNMPRINGKKVLQQIRGDKKLQHIPVIIYTTSKTKEQAEEMYQAGASLFLTKPAKYDELKKVLGLILSDHLEKIRQY